jgi:hypothetical protein
VPTFGVFCFLWDDPLFADWSDPEVWGPQDAVIDRELIALRRGLRLRALELLYMKIHDLEKDRNEWKEEAARGVWMWKRVVSHVPPEVAEQAIIDGTVCKEMDPDFTFLKAIDSME